ncbi:MAG: glycosyltransferase [Planctomycetota bacterium]|nr:glycosyltransferase [Planctomycetota bacterium]
MSPIHVTFVVTKFNVGGMERCITRVANGLNRELFRASVICLDRTGTAQDWLEVDDVEVIELRKGSGNSFQVIKKLASCLVDIRADVVHSHNWGTLVETALAAKRIKSISHVHAERGSVLGSDNPGRLKEFVRQQVMRWAIGRARTVMTNSHCVAGKIEKACGQLGDKLAIIPNGVDVPYSSEWLNEARHSIRSRHSISSNVFLLGTVGRLVGVKNFPLAIEALQLARKTCKHREVCLMIVGDGPERSSLEALVRKASLQDHVHFVGHQENAWQFLSAFDAYTNCSTSEGMSQSIMEAMAVGKPVIASNVGDSSRMLAGESPCGIIFNSQDALEFAKAIEKLVNSPEQSKLLARNSLLRHQDRYSERAMLDGFERMYSSAVSDAVANKQEALRK